MPLPALPISATRPSSAPHSVNQDVYRLLRPRTLHGRQLPFRAKHPSLEYSTIASSESCR
ncbi:hypothetical protein K431DRAFT_280092 [Polychaeton citri CBS 116435]|uniref:Uncharacterized protein n=1 Tax=Polychaeton citri CBS 116435 TaxID=1314669 RepID=A0A9P4QF04_9PEZI|nr:hypothetical protein K431DRAFT_280092 [Polychaeton citri CBS 116435]